MEKAMGNDVIIEGSSIDDAVNLAAEALGVAKEEIAYEVLEEAEKRLFAKNQPAKIRAWVENDSEDEPDVESEELSTKDHDTEDAEADEKASSPADNDTKEDNELEETTYFKRLDTLTEAELDELADTAIEALRSVLQYFGASDAAIDEYEGEEGELILDVVGDNLAVLIGRHGRTLDSLQFIVSSIVNKRVGFRYPLIIDIEGYKQRRRQKLESVAKSSAARAIRQNRDVRLRPMTPYERRIIHIALKNDPRIETSSEGKEPNRQVVIKVL